MTNMTMTTVAAMGTKVAATNDGHGTGPGNPGHGHGSGSDDDHNGDHRDNYDCDHDRHEQDDCGHDDEHHHGGCTPATGDKVIEKKNQGYDLVRSSVSYTLPDNVEALELLGHVALNGTCNALNNHLTGNEAANRLDGGTGADLLEGLAGDDTYLVDNRLDVVRENAGEGLDTVLASVSWTLAANLENLQLLGSAALNGSGNQLDNQLTGNDGANLLRGLAGNDTYVFDAGWGKDTVVDKDSTAVNRDVIQFGAGIGVDQLWFSKKGNNLQISLIGQSDVVTVQDWYKGDANHVEKIRTADGHALDHGQVAKLVQAMSGMSSPTGSQTCLNGTQRQRLDPVIAVTWTNS